MEPSLFLSLITYVPISARHLHQSFIKKKLTKIPPPVTFEKIWGILNLYWNFLSYGFLEHVIFCCTCDDLNQQMKEYIHELSIFKKRTRLCDFIRSWPCGDKRAPKSSLKKVVVKMQKRWSRCTLHDLELFKKALIHKFFLPEIDFLLRKAKRGCVCVTWLTSPSIATLLQQKVETEFFKKHGINLVTIDTVTIESKCKSF